MTASISGASNAVNQQAFKDMKQSKLFQKFMSKEKPVAASKETSVKGSFGGARIDEPNSKAGSFGGNYFQDMADKSKAGGFEKFKNQQLNKNKDTKQSTKSLAVKSKKELEVKKESADEKLPKGGSEVLIEEDFIRKQKQMINEKAAFIDHK